jgi:hypothetical protein
MGWAKHSAAVTAVRAARHAVLAEARKVSKKISATGSLETFPLARELHSLVCRAAKMDFALALTASTRPYERHLLEVVPKWRFNVRQDIQSGSTPS